MTNSNVLGIEIVSNIQLILIVWSLIEWVCDEKNKWNLSNEIWDFIDPPTNNICNKRKLACNELDNDKSVNTYSPEETKLYFLFNNKSSNQKVKVDSWCSLDKNNEGFLSYSNISFTNVEPGIMEALTPLIVEINKNKDKKIFFNEFKMLTNDSLIKYMMESN